MASSTDLAAELQGALAAIGGKSKKAIQAVNPFTGMSFERITSKVPVKGLSIRKVFKQRRGFTKSASASYAQRHAAEDEDDTSSDEDMTLEEIERTVDQKYFDPNYDATADELSKIPAVYDDDTKLLAELREREKAQKQELRKVNRFLQKKLLEDYEYFVKGMLRIHDVTLDLKSTAQYCKQQREVLKHHRIHFVRPGCLIPRQTWQKANLENLILLLEAVLLLGDRNRQLAQLRAENRFRDMLQVTRAPEKLDLHLLGMLTVAQPLIREWNLFSADPQKLLSEADKAIAQCFEKNFSERGYQGAMDAYIAMNDEDSGIKRAANALFFLGCNCIGAAVRGVSNSKSDDLLTAAKGVAPEIVLVCVCKLAARALDAIVVANRACDVHEKAIADPADSARHPFHTKALEALQQVNGKIAQILHEQVLQVISAFNYRDDIDQTLHIFFIASLLIEATSKLGADKAVLAKTRDSLKTTVRHWVLNKVVLPRAQMLVNTMQNESWQPEPELTASAFKVVGALSPAPYQKDVKWVRSYISARKCDASSNPFFDPKITEPQDITQSMQINDFACDPNRNLALSSTAALSNTLFILVCRIVTRFPPLATEVCDWMLSLMSLYSYVAGANFACTRSKPMEDVPDFSPAARETLKQMRATAMALLPSMSKRVYNHYDADQEITDADFPPVVYEQVRSFLPNQALMYGAVQRLTSLEAIFPVIGLLFEGLSSVGQLMGPTARQQQASRIERFSECCEEILHVGTHRVVSAWLDLSWLSADLAAMKWESRAHSPTKANTGAPEQHESPIVQKLNRALLAAFDQQGKVEPPLASVGNKLITTFWRHVVFAVQFQCVRGFARVQRATDSTVDSMIFETQLIHQLMTKYLGPHCFALETYTFSFLAAFKLDTIEERMEWSKKNGHFYKREDLIPWLSHNGSRDVKKRVESYMKEGHILTDLVPTEPFLAAAIRDIKRESGELQDEDRR